MSDRRPDVIRVVDLETTGNSFTDGGVVEIGWIDLRRDGGRWQLASAAPQTLLVRPPHPISAATSAIHHLIDEDVADAPSWAEASAAVLLPPAECRILAFAAHRAAFEQRWCGTLPSGVGWICTWKSALRVWPGAPTHSNQGLRYWRRPRGLDRRTAMPAHRAGPDAYVTVHHLRDLLEAAPFETLLGWSVEPALLVRVPFGPFRGRAWSDVEEGALERIAAGEGGGNGDVRFTARYELTRRREGAPADARLRTEADAGPAAVRRDDPPDVAQGSLPFDPSGPVSP